MTLKKMSGTPGEISLLPATSACRVLIPPETILLGVAAGTENMVKCMGITEKDRVVIITDHETLGVGTSIRAAVSRTGASVEFVMMEELGPRPLTALPPETADKVRALNPTASFFAATMQPGELGFRRPLIGMLLGEFNVRHAHMPGITNEVACGEAMCADYGEVHRLTHAVLNAVQWAKVIRVTTPAGTDITVELDPEHLYWHASDGKIQTQGMFHNLPDGEVFTSPSNVNGRFVTTLLGDYFSARYGVLTTPVEIEIKDGRAVSVSCGNKEIESELDMYLHKGENTDRVGEFAIGTNTRVTRLIGNMLADEKAAGVHIAFGDPLGDKTGATWAVSPAQHCDMVIQGCDIVVDGNEIMKNGRFLL